MQVAEARRALLAVIRRLRVRVRYYKVAVGWTLELARVKTNGRLVSRSPLSGPRRAGGAAAGGQGKEAGCSASTPCCSPRPSSADATRLGISSTYA